MLQRTSLMEKRKKKKVELDKNTQTAKIVFERDIKNQNKKSDNDYMEIEKLDPNASKFFVQEDMKSVINLIMKNVNDFVNIHNEYIVIKGNEEKAKVIYFCLLTEI